MTTITKAENGYILEMDGHTYVGTSLNDIFRIINVHSTHKIEKVLKSENDKCEIEIRIETLYQRKQNESPEPLNMCDI